MFLRECHECHEFRNDTVRRVPPATRIAGKPPISHHVCPSCANAQDAAVLKEAQKLLGLVAKAA